MFCDECDRGNHTYCLDPPLEQPPEGFMAFLMKGSYCCKVCVRRKGRRVNRVIDDDEEPNTKQVKQEGEEEEEESESSKQLRSLFASFGNQLSQSQASTKKCQPNAIDRHLFIEARRERDKSSASLKRLKATDAPPHIKQLCLGPHSIKTWYNAPFPAEYFNKDGTLYMCEFCLKYMKSSLTFHRHMSKCHQKHPPGDEIYRDGKYSVFEVNGRMAKNFCLLAKLFLDHKTLYYDVEPFLFYVFTEYSAEDSSYRLIGYFSKEKNSPSFNVSCILVVPYSPADSQGYLLSKKEGRLGTPEKPLSDHGLYSYKHYWTCVISSLLKSLPTKSASIDEISLATSMTLDDVVFSLEVLGVLQRNVQEKYVLNLDKLIEDDKRPLQLKAKMEKLHWTPYLSK